MKIQLIKECKFDYNNSIQDVTKLNKFLTEFNGLDIAKLKLSKNINGQNIYTSNLKFEEVFEDGQNGFNEQEFNLYNYAVVYNHYLYKNYSYWYVSLKYINEHTVKALFTLDTANTFGLTSLDLNKIIHISRMHINYSNQFEENGDLKWDSIFRLVQPTSSTELQQYKTANFFKNVRFGETECQMEMLMKDCGARLILMTNFQKDKNNYTIEHPYENDIIGDREYDEEIIQVR